MKTILAPILLLISLMVSGQGDTTFMQQARDSATQVVPKNGIANHTSGMYDIFSPFTGFYSPQINKLNKSLATGYSRQFNTSTMVYGVNWSGLLVHTRRSVYDAHIAYTYLQPQTINIGDSLRFTLQGFQLNWSIYGGFDVFHKSRHFDLLVYPGFNHGRLKLLRVEDSKKKYNNPFFAPKLALEPRLVIGRVLLSVRGEYMYDISKYKWKKKSDGLEDIGKASATGWLVMGLVGVRVGHSLQD